MCTCKSVNSCGRSAKEDKQSGGYGSQDSLREPLFTLPANIRCRTNVALLLVQRRRQWANIKLLALIQRLVFDGCRPTIHPASRNRRPNDVRTRFDTLDQRNRRVFVRYIKECYII